MPRFRKDGKRDRRTGSWLARQAKDADERMVAARQARRLRKTIYIAGLGTVNRGLGNIQKMLGFDLVKFLKKKKPGRRKLYFLDSGAGFLGISAGVKAAMGNDVHVTAINPFPFREGTTSRGLIKKMRKNRIPLPHEFEIGSKTAAFAEAGSRRAEIDEYHVTMAENFSTKKRYDVVLDSMGPALYSLHRGKILERYFTLLRPRGVMIITSNTAKAEIREKFGRDSEFAKKKGYYLGELEDLKHNGLAATKIPLNK